MSETTRFPSQRKLTERQVKALSRVYRGITQSIDPTLAKQLEAKALVMCHGYYERKEWNRTVAKLRIVSLTPAGTEVASLLVKSTNE